MTNLKTVTSNWTSEDRYEHRQKAVEVLAELKLKRKKYHWGLFPHPELAKTLIEKRID